MQISRFTPSYGVLLHCCWPAGAMEAAAAAASFLLRSFGASNLKRAAFLFQLQRVFGQWRNSWGASLPAIYILHPLCEAQTFNGTFPQLEIYCALPASQGKRGAKISNLTLQSTAVQGWFEPLFGLKRLKSFSVQASGQGKMNF